MTLSKNFREKKREQNRERERERLSLTYSNLRARERVLGTQHHGSKHSADFTTSKEVKSTFGEGKKNKIPVFLFIITHIVNNI